MTWLIPLAATISICVAAHVWSIGDYTGIIRLMAYAVALIVSLIAWLIWAVLT